MLEDAVLHVLQAVVVLVEDGSGCGDVEAILGLLAPRQLEHRVEPRANPALLRALFVRALELVDLLKDCGADGLGQPRLLQPLPVAGRSGRLVRTRQLPEFLTDGLELSPQEKLSLRLLHPLLDA